MCHSPRVNTWASCLEERQRKPPVGGSVNSTSTSSFPLEIDIPPNRESDTKVLPIGKVLIIQTTNLHNPPPNVEGSITAEVNHLIDQVMAEASSCKSKQSSLEKITEAAATTSPPQKLEVTFPPVDTSSQASMEEAEGSLEGIPTNISPIAAVYSSRSASPLVDPSELQANANRAIDNMLHLKRSLDVKRQKAIWELGAILHQNESQGAALITAAKAICSQAATEAKTNYQAAVMEAKTTKYHSIQAAEATCSKAISDAKAQTTSQAMMFQEEHCNYLWGLEEQALREESRSCQDILSSCQATLSCSPQSIRGCWLHHTIYYWDKHLHHLHLSSPQGPLPWKNRHPQLLLPYQCPNSLQD